MYGKKFINSCEGFKRKHDIDSKILYGLGISQVLLSGGRKFWKTISIEEKPSTHNNSDFGYVLESDLKKQILAKKCS